jgi:hypothetical protein
MKKFLVLFFLSALLCSSFLFSSGRVLMSFGEESVEFVNLLKEKASLDQQINEMASRMNSEVKEFKFDPNKSGWDCELEGSKYNFVNVASEGYLVFSRIDNYDDMAYRVLCELKKPTDESPILFTEESSVGFLVRLLNAQDDQPWREVKVNSDIETVIITSLLKFKILLPDLINLLKKEIEKEKELLKKGIAVESMQKLLGYSDR